MPRIIPKIIVDAREHYEVKDFLANLDCEVVEKSITPADYVLSEDCAVERKEFHDFLKSVYDGRLFEQAERMARAYLKPVLVVEGEFSRGLEEVSNPAVFWGALAKVMADYGLSVMFTSNKRHTAMLIYSLARKLQEEPRKRVTAKHKPRVFTLSQRQLLTVQSLPKIGPKRAEKLLERFGSVRRIFQASEKELLSVEGIGKRTAREIIELLNIKYPALEDI